MRSHRPRRMSNNYNEIPFGILVLQKLGRRCCHNVILRKDAIYKTSIFFLTFVAYTCYHLSRKPISVVKAVLHHNCTVDPNHPNTSDHCGYAPFDDANAQTQFGMLDSAFLFCYAIAMFFSGFVAERVSLRYFLAFGMMFSGVFTYLFGMARTWDIHNIWYFIFVQAFAGIFQTTGWPGVVAIVGRWFGKSKRGLIFGIWNSHTSIGNILGTLIAAAYVETDWALSFVVPGIIVGIMGFVMFLFLVDNPEIVGCTPSRASMERRSPILDTENGHARTNNYETDVNYRPTERTPILERQESAEPLHHHHTTEPISFWAALKIPCVVEFSLCLFFVKLVSYTFLYWLPLYIQESSTLSPSLSANVSTFFDVGGIVGAILAGIISDYSGMPATTCCAMLFLASPVLFIYQLYGAISIGVSIFLLVVAGLLVNGPFALITTSVSAELGQHHSLAANAGALATVTAIIDGTGSIGAAIGPLLAGFISSHGWQKVFHMLIASNVLAVLLLLRMVVRDFIKLRGRRVTRIRIE